VSTLWQSPWQHLIVRRRQQAGYLRIEELFGGELDRRTEDEDVRRRRLVDKWMSWIDD
jgi:hypothetical protein